MRISYNFITKLSVQLLRTNITLARGVNDSFKRSCIMPSSMGSRLPASRVLELLGLVISAVEEMAIFTS